MLNRAGLAGTGQWEHRIGLGHSQFSMELALYGLGAIPCRVEEIEQSNRDWTSLFTSSTRPGIGPKSYQPETSSIHHKTGPKQARTVMI